MVNENKIAFITCTNDESLYFECVRYIKSLKIPDGIEIEIIALKNENSITSAYNNAIKRSDAKYKVYLHQDTLIINKNFIYNVLDIFRKNIDIGMIGVIGAKSLGENCIYWESVDKCGEVYENHLGYMELLKFNEPSEKYEDVEAIDGLVMITQYDVRWREDLFDGWHFYDISQCFEFQKAGYRVIIPKQEKIWCLHNCGKTPMECEYERYKKIFMKEYK